jgi:hypothetical protein
MTASDFVEPDRRDRPLLACVVAGLSRRRAAGRVAASAASAAARGLGPVSLPSAIAVSAASATSRRPRVASSSSPAAPAAAHAAPNPGLLTNASAPPRFSRRGLA